MIDNLSTTILINKDNDKISVYRYFGINYTNIYINIEKSIIPLF